MSYQEVCVKDLKVGDRVILNNVVWGVTNYYGHDVQVQKLDIDLVEMDADEKLTDKFQVLLGNCIVKKVIEGDK